MPQDYGRVMGSMADTVAEPLNAFTRNYNAGQVIGQRNEELRQREQVRNALIQQQQQEQQQQTAQAEADDAEWDQAYAAKDWGAMARIDPQSTKILWEHEQASKPPSPIQYEKTPWGGQIAMQDGKKVGDWNPPAPQQYGPNRDIELANYLLSLPPDKRQAAQAALGGKGSAGKPLPTSALRMVDEANQAIAATAQSDALIAPAIQALEDGKVQLGILRNVESRTRNVAGKSDENSRGYASLMQTLEKLRNNYLLLAKGVQTEGDAQRAWNSEIGESVQNDNQLALQQLRKAQGMIQMAREAQQGRVESVYTNFGQEAPAQKGSPPTFATEAEAAAAGLQPGTRVVIGGVPGTWQ
jgi:hypothetical protein